LSFVYYNKTTIT